MTSFPIEVLRSGTVLLGPSVTCDGFHFGAKFRVQTHIHSDHMTDFATSKGLQDILLSTPTKQLLVAEFDADLPYRDNVHDLEYGRRTTCGSDAITLKSSGHMLGGVQAEVELAGGMRVGYSSDFHWPINDVIQVDALVVDSTYGSPSDKRSYSEADAEHALVQVVTQKLLAGPVHIHTHRGTLQRALQVLAGNVRCRTLASPRLIQEIDVYRAFGYGSDQLFPTDSDEARQAIREGTYLQLYGPGDGLPVELAGTQVAVSAYMSNPQTPLLEYSERSYRVAMSNHADFEGTLAYVQATGARYVVTDNTRGKGVELALALNSLLGIAARPSTNAITHKWD